MTNDTFNAKANLFKAKVETFNAKLKTVDEMVSETIDTNVPKGDTPDSANALNTLNKQREQ